MFRKKRSVGRSKYLEGMRAKIFPFRMVDVKLKYPLMLEPNYKKIIAVCPKTPTHNEMEYLLKYKIFVDHPDVHSMCDVKEVDQIETLLNDIIENEIPGCIVETGSWRGGAGMIIKAILKDRNADKNVYLFDTFKYFPKPTPKSNTQDESIHSIVELLFENMHSVAQVRSNFRRLGLLDSKVYFIEGLFQDTIPITDVGAIAILRLDSDYYESTLFVLEHYYKNIVKGGFLIIDDYNNYMLGCKTAVHFFREKYQIKNEIIDTHGGSVFWRI
jgi:hypothetical protein